MKRKLSTVLIILIILAGLSLLLYPTVSDYLKTMAYRRAISDFRQSVETLDPETYEDILASAREYNEALLTRGSIKMNLTEEELAEYENQLVIPGTDVMGYVVIPKINVSIPIYHGTDEAVLQSGVGHLEGSSLPVGGEGTHTVLSGHRGLPSATLFTNIDQLVVGDTFTVRTLGEVLTYEVDQITTVLPYELGSLRIEPDRDYCTLLTCTPYGVNTHRLLVRGHRIPTPAEEEGPIQSVLIPEDGRIFGVNAEIVLLIAAGVLCILIVTIIVVAVRSRRKRHSGK